MTPLLRTLAIALALALTAQGATTAGGPEPLVAFALKEGSELRLYTSRLDGSDRRLIRSHALVGSSAGRMRATDRFLLSALPGGAGAVYKIVQPFAFRDWARGEHSMLKRHGERALLDGVSGHLWSPDGQRILYCILEPPPASNPELAAPIFEEGPAEWRVRDMSTGSDTVIPRHPKLRLTSGWWLDSRRLLFAQIGFSGFTSTLVAYDLATTSFGADGPRTPRAVRDVIPSPSGRRTVLVLANEDPGLDEPWCELRELTSDFQLGPILASFDPPGIPVGVFWNGDDEVYFNDMNQRPRSGTRCSVVRYSFATGQTTRVVEGVNEGVIRLEGVLGGVAMVTQRAGRTNVERAYVEGGTPHVLESRDLRTGRPTPIVVSDEEIMFLGFLR